MPSKDPTLTRPIVNDATPAAAFPAASAAPQPERPQMTRSALGAEFARVLGIDEQVPATTWRSLGNPETLGGAMKLIVAWFDQVCTLTSASTRSLQSRPGAAPEMPNIPHVTELDKRTGLPTGREVPAPGTRELFDVCVEAWRGGLSPSAMQSEWTTQMRRLVNATQGAPGYRVQRR